MPFQSNGTLGNGLVLGAKTDWGRILVREMIFSKELAIADPDEMLFSGMFVRAEIVKKVAEASISVPLYTVITRNGEQFVYVEEGGVAKRRPVKMGILEDWRVQIKEGLVPGDRVIVEGHRNVEDGQRVNIVRTLSEKEGALR